ncbi:MAG: hypothetical protein JXQ96_09560 [Cyclobacteriaceae bacterium]
MGSQPPVLLKRRVITWTSILIVLGLASFGMLKLGIYFSSEILHRLVLNETNGYYQLSFESLEIDVWERAIKLEKVILKPDSNKDFQAKGFKNLYDLELAGLNIDLESFSSIYFEDQLAITNVRIIDPQIHIIREKHAPAESFSLQTGDLYKEISDYLKVLRIDLFSLENGEFQHSPSNLGFGDFDFFVNNLLIDSESRPDQEFYSESIELEIRNQSFYLNDSIHQLSFDRMVLSTADSVLTFNNLVLRPITEAHGTFGHQDHKIVYNIRIPDLKLKGVDYFSAYRNNHLEMQELALTDSHIFLEEQTHAELKKQEAKGNSLIKQLFQIFDEIQIGKMRFINSNLDITTNDDYHHKYQHIKSERADIVFYNVLLDSSNYHFDHRDKYFDDVDIIIKDYSSYLPDSIHTVEFDLLQLSSFDSSLLFKNFHISNHGKRSSSDMFLSIDLPMLSFKGMNFLDVLVNQELLINELRLQYPKITFEKERKRHERDSISPTVVYSILNDHFRIVNIKSLQLDQGEFSINKHIHFGQTDLVVSDFNIHGESKSWHEVLGEVELTMEDMVLNDETTDLRVSNLTLDHIASRLLLDQINMDYQDQNKSVSGNLSQLTISGIDLDGISSGNYLAFDSLKLTNPVIDLEIINPAKDGLGDDYLGNKYIEIENGQITGKSHDATSFSMNNINTQLTIGTHNKVYNGRIEQITFTLPKSSNQFNISELSIIDSGDVHINGINILRTPDSIQNKVELNGNIPSLSIYGLNQDAFWQQKLLHGDSLIVQNPNLILSLNDVVQKASEIDTLGIEFKKIILDKAQLEVLDKGQTAIVKAEILQLSLILKNFQYPEKSVLDADHLLYSDDVLLNVKGFKPTMTNGDSLVIELLSFNKSTGLILIDTLSYNKADKTANGLLPSIKIVGLDLYAFQIDKRLKLDSIQLTNCYIVASFQTSKADGKSFDKSFPKSIDVKYFSSIETEIEIQDSLKSTEFAVHEGRFEIREFFVEEEVIGDEFFDYTQFAAISGKNLSLPLGDSYSIIIDQYDLQYPSNTLNLDKIRFSSELTADEYSNNLKVQKDWFDVSLDGMRFSGLDYERLLSESEYHVEKISLEGLDALVYRDKDVPFKSTFKALPQSMLRNIDAWIYIDTLKLNGNITYHEKPAKKEEIAQISFGELDAALFHITSVDSMAKKPLHLVAKGQFADTANFRAIALFDMQSPKDNFTFGGQVDSLHLGALNKLLRPVAGINIKDGYAPQMNFNIEANNEFARGEMGFRYKDLKVQILNPETNDLKGLNQGIKTFFANTFVLKHRNPKFLFLRPGKIFHERDTSRAVFNYWGKALLSGVVSSVGIHKSRKAEKRWLKKRKDKE